MSERREMHQQIDTDDGLVDVWELHDEGYKRQVPLALSFCCYALSPSTKEVVFFFDSTGLKEARAYGSRGEMVWYELLPGPYAPLAFSYLGGLYVQMRKAGKLTLA